MILPQNLQLLPSSLVSYFGSIYFHAKSDKKEYVFKNLSSTNANGPVRKSIHKLLV